MRNTIEISLRKRRSSGRSASEGSSQMTRCHKRSGFWLMLVTEEGPYVRRIAHCRDGFERAWPNRRRERAEFGAAQASASSAPIVIQYAKTCDETVGRCVGTAGGVTIVMQITSFRATGKAAKLTATEWITVGDISFRADMKGNCQPGRVHRVERHGHGGRFRGRAGPPAKQPCGRRRDHDVVDRRAPAHAGECVSRTAEAARGWAGSRPLPRVSLTDQPEPEPLARHCARTRGNQLVGSRPTAVEGAGPSGATHSRRGRRRRRAEASASPREPIPIRGMFPLVGDTLAICEADRTESAESRCQRPQTLLRAASTALLTGALLVPAVAHSEMEHGPKPPTGLRIVNSSSETLTLSWNAGGTSAAQRFELHADGKSVGSTTEQQFTFTGLSCGMASVLSIEALDTAGRSSEPATVTASPARCPAATPPTPAAVPRASAPAPPQSPRTMETPSHSVDSPSTELKPTPSHRATPKENPPRSHGQVPEPSSGMRTTLRPRVSVCSFARTASHG